MATSGMPEPSHARVAGYGLGHKAGRMSTRLRRMGRPRAHLFRPDDERSPVERARRLALQSASLARLPRPVATFWLRAMRRAQAEKDTWSIDVACRPAELRV